MKVIILGPLIDNSNSAGVSVFDEGLYNGFLAAGDEVFAISLSKSINIDNILLGNGRQSPKKIFRYFRRIANIIKSLQPDIVISSLHYSLGIKYYKRKWNNAQYVQVLHGFACPINGRLRAWMTNTLIKRNSKFFDKNIAVSFLTYAINSKMLLINCDGYINNGCSITVQKTNHERKYDFVYVGRLAEDKGIRLIADSFLMLKEKRPSLKFAIAGYGELEKEFKVNGIYFDKGIDYLGKINQKEVSDLLSASKFFISMNSLEPFGIAFCEALMNGCNIVTQSTSGFAPFLFDKKYFHQADCTNPIDLCKRLLKIVENFYEIPFDERDAFADQFSFVEVANKYKKICGFDK